MSWPINSNDDEELQKIPTNTLLRWFLYDVAGKKAKEEINVFELTPVSQEGDEKELDDSEKRVRQIEDLFPILTFYSDATAEYAFSLHKKQLADLSGITDEILEASEEPLKDFYLNMTFSALVSALASLNSLGIIKVNGAEISIGKDPNE